MVAALSLLPPVPSSLRASRRVEGKAVGTCKVLLRLPQTSFLPSCLPPLSLSAFFPAPRMPATKRATPVITTRVAACLRKPLLWKGYCMQPARKEGRKERTNERERMTSAFVGNEDNGEGKCHKRGERERAKAREQPRSLKFVTAQVHFTPESDCPDAAQGFQNPT